MPGCAHWNFNLNLNSMFYSRSNLLEICLCCVFANLSGAAKLGAVEQRIPLEQGWNSVVFQIVPADSNPHTLFETIGGSFLSAWTYDAHTQRWRAVFGSTARADASLINELDPLQISEIKIGQGYLINLSADVDWEIAGIPTQSGLPVVVASGWNLLGIPVGRNSVADTLAIGEVLPKGQNDYSKILNWDQSVQRFMSTSDSELATIDFDPNRAFWIFAAKPSLLLSMFVALPSYYFLEPEFTVMIDEAISKITVPFTVLNDDHTLYLGAQFLESIIGLKAMIP